MENKIWKIRADKKEYALQDLSLTERVNGLTEGASVEYSTFAKVETKIKAEAETRAQAIEERASTIIEYVDQEVSDTKQHSDDNLATAKQYSDNNLNDRATAILQYVDKEVGDAERYTAASLDAAKKYSDDNLAAAKQYSNDNLAAGKAHTNALRDNIENGTTVAYKAQRDANGNKIVDTYATKNEAVLKDSSGNATLTGRLITATGLTVQGGTTTIAGTTTINGSTTLNGSTTTVNSQTTNFTGKIQAKDINSTGTITMNGQPVLTKFKLVKSAEIENNSFSGTIPEKISIYDIVQQYDEVRVFIYNTRASGSTPMKYFIVDDSSWEVVSIGTSSDVIKITMEKLGDLQEWTITNADASTEAKTLDVIYGEQQYITDIGIQNSTGSSTLSGSHMVWVYAR